MAVKHIKTKTGFEMDLDESVTDDMELFEAIAEVDSGNMMKVPVVIGKLCGDQKKALYDHVRTEDGRVPMQAISEEITDIFEALNAKKS